MLIVISAFFWTLILLPSLFLTFFRWQEEKQHVTLLATWAASLFLFSFFFLPWLDLQPLKHFGVEWIYDAIPVLEIVAGWFGAEFVADAASHISGLDLLFSPPGWLTLLITARPLIWLIVTCLGTVSIVFAWLTSAINWREAGLVLSISSSLLLLFILCNLPNIDGLGERSFPSLLAIAVPLLGVQLIWVGPFVMIFSLILMIVAGLVQLESTQGKDFVIQSDWDV